MTTKKILFLALITNLILILIGVLIGNPPEQYFSKEATYITWVSFIQLLIIAYISKQIFQNSRIVIWGIITFGFLFLAIDEVARIHENLDLIIHRIFHLKQTPLTDRLDDIIVALYGVIGLITMFLFKHDILKYKKSFLLFTMGFFLFFLMAIADMSVNNHDLVRALTDNKPLRKIIFSSIKVLEEGFKLFAEAFFISAFYKCLEISRELKNE